MTADNLRYEEGRPYLAHLEFFDPQGDLVHVKHDPIDEWESLMNVNEEGGPVLRRITLSFADGSEMIVTRNFGPWGDGSVAPAPPSHFDDDVEFEQLCSVCYDPIDYCQGHGEMG